MKYGGHRCVSKQPSIYSSIISTGINWSPTLHQAEKDPLESLQLHYGGGGGGAYYDGHFTAE